MKTYWGVEVHFYAFLILAVDGDEWSASCTSCFTLRERTPGTHWIGGWVGSRASLNEVEEEKNSQPLLGIKPYKPHHPAHSLATILTELSQLFALKVTKLIVYC
jgi:hypothetical protein